MKRVIIILLFFIGIVSVASYGSDPKPTGKAQSGQGAIIIVFKDGHRQSIKMADIARIEFGAPEGRVSSIKSNAPLPGRNHFIGKWEVGDGTGRNFFIELKEDGHAEKSIGAAHGTWELVNGEAQITWDDGAHDAIRKVGSKHEKFAYGPGKRFSDQPDNVTDARATNPKPL